MAIISSIPFPNFIDGVTVASGAQVNANNTSLINQINANAAANGANSDITTLAGLTAPPSGRGSIVFAGGIASGTANAIVIGATNPTGYPFTVGDRLTFLAAAPPTSSVLITVNGDQQVLKKWLNGSLVNLTGGEWQAGQVVETWWDGTQQQLLSPYQPVVPALGIIGEIRQFCFGSIPALFLGTQGQAVSRSTYAALFAAIGTTFGPGNGSTTFNLPNLNGQFIRGYDNSGSIDPGRGFGTLQADSIIDHIHALTGPLASTTAVGGTGITVSGPAVTTATAGVSAPNGGFAETRPKNIALQFAIYAGA